jgi:hypothetical protein
MTVKNYGAATSGYLNPDGRSWETTVYQASKPVLDKELNLVQDTEQDAELKLRRKSFPSGWVSDEFLNTSVGTSIFSGSVTTANQIQLVGLTAYVNGWLLNVANTGNNTGLNVLDLGVGPSGVGSKRTDLIVLEVWRRLIPAAASTGKSPAARIWKDGNVKIASADDLTLNFADDILDTGVGAETTKRVQIQYRLRVVQGVDVFTYAFGINDPSVVANSVPTNAATPDGVATVYTYANQSAVGDPGLWVAGNGDPNNTLGTVDGFMYAMPVAVVFRRNSTAFARNTNQNGGVVYPGPSTRPDGLFTNIIVANDVYDLRTGSSPTGWDFQEVLQKNFNFLLDNSIQTEIDTTTIGGGVNGHTYMWADEIGVSNANGGDGVITGDTPGGEFVGEFDAIRRTYSDRAVYETFVLRYVPANSSGGGPNWNVGDTITIAPSALPVFPYNSFNWAAYAPSAISFVDISRVAFIGETAGDQTIDISASGWSATNLGAVPQGPVVLTLVGPTLATSSPLFVTVTVSYPSGVGLTKTPTNVYADNATVPTVAGVFINNPGQLPTTTPIYYRALNPPSFNKTNREITLTYSTQQHSRPYFTTTAQTKIQMPERVDSTQPIVLTINGSPYGGSVTVGGDGYSLNVAGGVVTGGQTISIAYSALRPMPQNNEQFTIYYEARAPQTVRSGVLPSTLTVNPRLIAQQLYTLTAGSGSDGDAYPFPTQYVQTGGVYPSTGGTFSGDHELDGNLRVSVTTLFADTGFMQLGVQLPLGPAPEGFGFIRSGGNVDIEGRSFYPASSTSYQPFALAQPLSDPKRHKNMLPILAQLTQDTPFGFKGQLVLLLLSRWAPFDDSNSVMFVSNLVSNTTSASVYRLKGNLLSNRRG